MNWWQLGLLILGILALTWLLPDGRHHRGRYSKQSRKRKHDSKRTEKQP